MTYEMYDIVVPEFITLLTSMKGYFAKAEAHADAKKYDVNNLLTARLSPDQYSLAKQVNVTCFLAEECVSKAAGKPNPGIAAQDGSVKDLLSRIDRSVQYLKTITREDLAGWEERPADIFFAPGKYLPGNEYLVRFGVPNFYFHLVTVYAILRHNGVDVGKMDYIGPVNFLEKKA